MKTLFSTVAVLMIVVLFITPALAQKQKSKDDALFGAAQPQNAARGRGL